VDAATFDEGGTRRVRTILGLSKTSTSIGWVLVDEQDVAAADPLDYDAFDITEGSTAAPATTARRVRAIATASGYTVDSVHVTSSGNLSSLRDALTECGFDDVVSVPLTEATRSWGRDTGYANAMEKTAICVLGQDSAALSMVQTRSGAVQSTTTTITGDLVIFTDWLNFAMGADGSYPEVLYLIGSRPKLEEVADHLDRALSVPVVAANHAQIALARGAASSNGERPAFAAVERTGFAVHARALTVVAAVAVVSFFTLSSAGSSIPLAASMAAQTAIPPAEPDVPVAPMVLLPPPAATPAPVPAVLPRPDTAPMAITPDSVVPESIPVAVPAPAAAMPPVEHLPDPQAVQHLPGGQTAPAPGPDIPPADPAVGVPNPVFGPLP
jgi:hypothetical protein